MREKSDFVGQGMSFPLAIDRAGSFLMVSGSESLESSITMILSTAPGERVHRPRFGCQIWELLFEPISPELLGRCEQAVETALEFWEPRIDVVNVEARATSAEGEVEILIDYVVKIVNERRNLVFPFYVIPSDGESDGLSES